MANNRWLGTATAVAQVDTFTPANIEVDDVFTLTVTGYDGTSDSISYTAVDTSATTVSGALISAWNAKTSSLFSDITASGTDTVILTADTPGVGFKVTSSAVDGGGTDTQTFTRAATTPNGGPNDWQDGNNWSLGNAPGENGAGEDVYVANSSVDILYGLDNTGASATVDSIHIEESYTGKIGHNGITGTVGDYLQVKVSELFIGENFTPITATGSGRIKIDTGAVTCAATIYNTSASADSGKPACRLIGTALTIKDMIKGSLGVAFDPSETASIPSVNVSYENKNRLSSDATVTIGSGTTMTSFTCDGGNNYVQCAATTINANAGELLISGEGAITTLNCNGANVYPVTTGTITTTNVNAGVCDFTKSSQSRTATTINVSQGSTLKINKLHVSGDVVIPTTEGRTQVVVSSA